MSFILHPWHLLLVILAGWINQLQQQIIEFQRTEIDVLKRKLGKKRIICPGPPTFVVRGFGQSLLRFCDLRCPVRKDGLRTYWRQIGPNVSRDWLPSATAKSQPGRAVTVRAVRAWAIRVHILLSRPTTFAAWPSSMGACLG